MKIITDYCIKAIERRRVLIFILILSFCFLTAAPQIPPGYYNPAIGQTGQQLQISLYNIIKGHSVVNYTPGVWNAFFSTDVKSDGYIWDMYTDIPGGVPQYNFTPGSDQCGSGGGGTEGDCYSREHSFPKSWFNDSTPMNTDLFHIYPVDQYVNNHHNNYPYGKVGTPTFISSNGSKVGPCVTLGYTGTVFEPIDEYKGDFARSYFYMATRYQNLIATWPSYDPNGAAVLDGSSYPAFKTWYINMLIAWNNQDPVSAKELARNDSVYKIQNNRNPYIDHPEYVEAVWMPGGPKAEPTNHVTNFSAAAGTPSYSAITLSWADATGAVIPDGYLLRGSSTGFSDIQAPADGIAITDGGLDKNVASLSQAWTFTSLSPVTAYYFKIFPYTNSGSYTNYKTDGTVPAATLTTTAGISILQPGDLAIIELNAQDTDKVSFITFRQLNAGTVINFTDNGFTSPTTVRTGEGFLVYTAPSIIPVGTVVSWHRWMDITGTGWNTSIPSGFLLATTGDQVFAYQGTWGAGQTVLYGAESGNAAWLTTGMAGSNTSYLPSALVNNVTAITFAEKNGYYNLIKTGTANALGSLMAYPANWTKNSALQQTPAWNFMITTGTVINQPATVQNMLVGSGETFTIQPVIKFTVLGNFTISNGY